MNSEPIVTIATAIVGVAIIALLVSNKSNTVGVIQNIASGFSNALGVAVSPVTGSSVQVNTGYASGSGALSLPGLPALSLNG